jgi:hypothetical protein
MLCTQSGFSSTAVSLEQHICEYQGFTLLQKEEKKRKKKSKNHGIESCVMARQPEVQSQFPTSYYLFDLGQDIYPLSTAIFSLVKWGKNTS